MATRTVNVVANTWTNIQSLIAAVGKSAVVGGERAFEIAHSVAAPAGAGTAVAAKASIQVIQTTLHTTGNVWVRSVTAQKINIESAGAPQVLFSNA